MYVVYPMAALTITPGTGPYANIDCNQTTSDPLGTFRHVYGQQNTARRIGTHLKLRHCAPPIYPALSFGTPKSPNLSKSLPNLNKPKSHGSARRCEEALGHKFGENWYRFGVIKKSLESTLLEISVKILMGGRELSMVLEIVPGFLDIFIRIPLDRMW
ncbi:hypothetical protein TNCV_4988081 [Trichonephila clavipes]|nr:hypothetical protein TNCV_4988081 [Trichonephila clavipes]